MRSVNGNIMQYYLQGVPTVWKTKFWDTQYQKFFWHQNVPFHHRGKVNFFQRQIPTETGWKLKFSPGNADWPLPGLYRVNHLYLALYWQLMSVTDWLIKVEKMSESSSRNANVCQSVFQSLFLLCLGKPSSTKGTFFWKFPYRGRGLGHSIPFFGRSGY